MIDSTKMEWIFGVLGFQILSPMSRSNRRSRESYSRRAPNSAQAKPPPRYPVADPVALVVELVAIVFLVSANSGLGHHVSRCVLHHQKISYYRRQQQQQKRTKQPMANQPNPQVQPATRRRKQPTLISTGTRMPSLRQQHLRIWEGLTTSRSRKRETPQPTCIRRQRHRRPRS